ncbi:MAG: universal stress protein [Bauldia sp.]
MSYRSILVHVDGDAGSSARVRLAADLAQRFEASLTGMCAAMARPVIEMYGAGMASAEIADVGREEVTAELKAAEGRFNEALAGSSVKRAWRAEYDFPAAALADAAAAHDLLVVGQDRGVLRRDAYTTVIVGDLLMSAGRPVLVAPPGQTELAAGNVLVAWKNSTEAKRAIVDALPLLARAKKVQLLQIGEGEDGRRSLDAAQAHLAAHRLAATADMRPRGKEVDQDILSAAAAAGADLIVAGAYGHSRMREWVLGGVTRTLLTKSPIAVLLSH